MTRGKYIGAPVRRREDPRFLRGEAAYVDDLRLPGTLSVAFVRSPHAHARIERVSVERAAAQPGVARILTGPEAAEHIRPLRIELNVDGFRPTTFHPLALDRVRFVGEAIVAVAASDRYIAEDAAELVDVQFTPLPAVTDAIQALEPGAPRLHDQMPDNVHFRRESSAGRPDDAFATADVVVHGTFRTGRCTGVPLEGRACLAHWERGRQQLTVWSSTQIPHTLRVYLAGFLGLPEHRVRVIAPDVGGGFGIKFQVFPEEILTCLLSMLLARPVKWIEDRRESLAASVHSREHVLDVEAAFCRDGTLLGMRARIVCDVGAYSSFPNGAIQEPAMAAQLLPGPYRFDHYAFETIGVATNKCPVGPYRGVARPTATYARESLVDMAAERLGLDPGEIRRRNLVRDDEFPYASPAGVVYESGAYLEALREALTLAGYDKLREEQAEARRDHRCLGVGIACLVEDTAKGSAYYAARGSTVMPRADSARVRVEPSGSVTVVTAVSPQGQGHETALAQVAADELGVRLDDVVVQHSDTTLGVFGAGTFASRSAVIGGGAITLAARAVRTKICEIAAYILGAAPEDLEVTEGQVLSRVNAGRQISVADVARRAYLITGDWPAGLEPGLEATAYYDPPPITWSNAVHVAAVEVDRATGEVRLRGYVVVEDCGRVINPVILDGQVQGGVAQGIGNALYEEIVYDQDGQLLTGSLMDYLIPTAVEVPEVRISHMETPSPFTVGGYKGAGEGGTIGPPAAIANAVSDALGQRVFRLPLTPDRVRALAAAAPQKP